MITHNCDDTAGCMFVLLPFSCCLFAGNTTSEQGGFDAFVITHNCDNTAGCMCIRVPCACGLYSYMSSMHEMPVNTRRV